MPIYRLLVQNQKIDNWKINIPHKTNIAIREVASQTVIACIDGIKSKKVNWF